MGFEVDMSKELVAVPEKVDQIDLREEIPRTVSSRPIENYIRITWR